MDSMQREGRYEGPPQAGNIIGVEFCRTIEKFGSEDHGYFKAGDEVFGLSIRWSIC